MEHKHFARAHEIHSKLGSLVPAVSDEVKVAQAHSALSAEFPELNDGDLESLANEAYEFHEGHFVPLQPEATEPEAADDASDPTEKE